MLSSSSRASSRRLSTSDLGYQKLGGGPAKKRTSISSIQGSEAAPGLRGRAPLRDDSFPFAELLPPPDRPRAGPRVRSGIPRHRASPSLEGLVPARRARS